MDRSQPPQKVSPLIKGARWSFLIAGVLYGSARFNVLNRREQKRKAELERTRPEREAKEKAEKLRISKEEEMKLAKEVGVQIES